MDLGANVIDTFELSIFDSGDQSRAIVVARRGHDLAIEPLACDSLPAMAVFRDQLAAAAQGTGQRPPSAALTQFGERLFSFCVKNSVDRIYQRLPNSYVRVHILSNRADLQALPWEYLQEPGTTPGPNSLRSVVRIVPTIGIDPPAPVRLPGRKLRVLFVYADPIDQQSVSWEDIKESLEREFAAHAAGAWDMDLIEGASPDALNAAVDARHYDILHFAGHGQISAAGQGELVFMDVKSHQSKPLAAATLGTLLRDKQLRLAVLSACSSSAGDFARPFSVVAKTLVESNVPAVVANQFPITNSIAAKFAGAFYRELLRSGDVDQATSNGRLSLYAEPDLPNQAARFEWGIPTLYRHVGAALVWKP